MINLLPGEMLKICSTSLGPRHVKNCQNLVLLMDEINIMPGMKDLGTELYHPFMKPHKLSSRWHLLSYSVSLLDDAGLMTHVNRLTAFQAKTTQSKPGCLIL